MSYGIYVRVCVFMVCVCGILVKYIFLSKLADIDGSWSCASPGFSLQQIKCPSLPVKLLAMAVLGTCVRVAAEYAARFESMPTKM